MSDENVTGGVIECVAQSLAIEAGGITTTSRIIADLGADSLDFMDIMFALERKFEIKLQKEDFDLLTRLGMKKEDAIVDGNLTAVAKQKLKTLLPGLPLEGETKPKDLGLFITVDTLRIIVEEFVRGKMNEKVAVLT